jgi:preprotein translocase subunit YajC
MKRAGIQDCPPGRRKVRSRAWINYSFVLAGVLVFLFCLRVQAQTQTQARSEYQVKAAYLFTFSRFVDWPQTSFMDSEQPLVIGIVGKDPFGSELQDLLKTVHGRRAVIEHLKWDQELSHCHVLFISRSERKHLGAILEKTNRSSVLTVSEIDDFVASGGIIGLVFDDDQVRFEINLDQATKSQLKISSHLSAMARVVKAEGMQSKNRFPTSKKMENVVTRP